MTREESDAGLPWNRGIALEQILRDIEQIAVSRGAVRGKQRINTNVDGLPLELQAFLSWFDPDIWSGFVNPAQERISDRVVFSVDGEQITEDHPDDRVSDPIYILRPDEICSLNVRDESTSAFATVTDCYEDLGWDSKILDAQFYWFGRDQYFCDFLLARDDNFVSEGSVVYTIEDVPPFMWLACSLREWLERMVYFKGIEYAMCPGEIHQLPDQDRLPWIRSFSQMNPQVKWFEAK